MGLYMEFMWPYMLWMLVFCIVGTIVFWIINKLWMYHGAEDEEEWDPKKEHFSVVFDTSSKE